MGFGILFVGYFLLLSFAYAYFTDALAAAVMLYALYKLAYLNDGFKNALRTSVGFLVFGLCELGISFAELLLPTADLAILFGARAIFRHLLIFALSFFILDGVKKVAKEVDLPYLAKRCVRNVWLTLASCVLSVILEATSLTSFVEARVIVGLYLISIVFTIAVISLNLVQIYGAHMRIYLPENDAEKESKFGFVNAFRRHEEEKSREYAEYKLEKMKAKKAKKRKK
jgi:hypothetical protein